MIQVKMKYGIDLGTTNSAICKLENGETVIVKTETLKDTMPSCISFTKKKVVKAGDAAMNDLRSDKSRATRTGTNAKSNVYIEFKRTMGLDKKYSSSNMGKDFNSEDLSSEVLKALKSFVSDDAVTAAVITIPAKFKTDQIAATKRAATLAGITSCELLQEPIAASMAYGLSTDKKNGIWLVFDFGGGTFDAALIKVEDGIMQVIDTEGDNYLGGKNLDYAIVDGIIIPHLQNEYAIDDMLENDTTREILRDAMKYYAEQAKNQLSFQDKVDITSQLDEFGEDDDGDELELDLIITRAQVKEVLYPIFQKAVDICKELLKRNNIDKAKLDTLILVGGPTHSPILRDMLREQITPNVDTRIDPMTAVAKGAALYAAGIDVISDKKIEVGTVALEVAYESDSVETQEFVTVKLLPQSSKGKIPSQLFVQCIRSDKGWSSGKTQINEMGDVIEVQLLEGKANSFSIVGYDNEGNRVPCYPEEFTIIQGSKVGSAVLPYNIGIEVFDTNLKKEVFTAVKGLEKNKALPAIGVKNGLRMPKQIRPGIVTDRLVIPIYQGEYAAEGSSAIHNDHVFDVVISGDDVPALIPEDSNIDITIKVDRSQQFVLEVNFNAIGETIEKEIKIEQRSAISAIELEAKISEAERKIERLEQNSFIPGSEKAPPKKIITDVRERYEAEKGQDDGRTNLLADLRQAYLKIEQIENKYEWESLESNLREEFERLKKANNELGNKYDKEVEDVQKQTDVAIKAKDTKIARTVLNEINGVFLQVTFIYQLINILDHFQNSFDTQPWKDIGRARNLLNQASQIIADNPTVEKLHPICVAMIDLLDLPKSEKPLI